MGKSTNVCAKRSPERSGLDFAVPIVLCSKHSKQPERQPKPLSLSSENVRVIVQ